MERSDERGKRSLYQVDMGEIQEVGMKYKEECIRIAKHYGDQQFGIVTEELAELIQAISKYQRKPGEESKTNVTEEMADVYIMLEQLKHLLGISDANIEKVELAKIKRQFDRMGVKKHCYNCKHGKIEDWKNPCRTCKDFCNWEPKEG